MTKTIILVLISTVVLATYLGVDCEITSKDWQAFDVAYPQAAAILACRSGFVGFQNSSVEAFVKCQKSKLDPRSWCFKQCMWVELDYIERGGSNLVHTDRMKEAIKLMFKDEKSIEDLIKTYRECAATQPFTADTDEFPCSGVRNFTLCVKKKNNKFCKDKKITIS